MERRKIWRAGEREGKKDKINRKKKERRRKKQTDNSKRKRNSSRHTERKIIKPVQKTIDNT